VRPLSEQVIVITGASSGIGRATALAAAGQGARLVLAARGEDALEATRGAVEDAGGEALAVPTEVADAGQVRALGRHAVERFGRIDTWVNAAAVSVYGEFLDLPVEEFRRVVDVNLMGTVYGTKVALDQMRRQPEGGAVVNVSSGLGDRAVPLQSAYSATKYAVNGLGDALRVELAHADLPLRVATIKPASIDTPFFGHARSRTGQAPRPFPPVYAPEVVADAILYAATHPVRELSVGGGAVGLSLLQRLAPRLLDWQLRLVGYAAQQSDRPKPPAAADNLEAPVAGPGDICGGWNGRRFSVATWLGTHPAARRALLGGAALAGVVAARGRRG